MRLKTIVFVVVGLFLLQSSVTFAGERKKKKSKEEKVEVKKESAYDKLFKGQKCETVKGMITIHKMDGKVYFEFPLNLLNKDMLLGSTITQITNNGFGSVGEKPYDPLHITFVKRDSSMNLCAVNTNYTTKDENIGKRIEESTIPAVMQTFKIMAYNADSTAVVFDVTDYFLSNEDNIGPFSPYAPILYRRRLEKEFKKQDSQITGIKAYADNVSVESSLSYVVSVSDQRYYYIYKAPFNAVMTRSIILLPEEPMRPRYADPRIGIFVGGRSEFTSDGSGIQPRYFANRWRLEPSDVEAYKRGELVEPVKPIVFYVDNTFPEAWRKYIKEGVEQWQAAFEAIGFKNAIIAKDFPTDDPEFDPDNLKYSCVRYSPSWTANAMGPSWTDPRTGEILNASVYLYHNLIELVQNWRFIQGGPADPSVRKMVLDEETLGDCIHYVVAHEIGHCLSLMHNMGSSSAIPVDSLRSPSFTQKYGTTYSIMDYARNNYVAQPGDAERGVKMTPPDLGVYDMYAIHWLYTPIFEAKTSEEEVPVLDKWITEKSHDPIYRYGKQQINYRIDPSAMEEDLGDDAIKAATYGVKNLKYLMKNLNNWIGDEDKDFRFRENIYNEVIYQYFRYINHVIFNIGGIYLNERYAQDARPSYKSVETEKQKRATQFMLAQLKDLAWLNDQSLLKNFEIRSNIISDMEDAIWEGLTKRFGAVAMSADKAEKNPYTQKDYMKDLMDFVWAPTKQGKSLSNIEKKLQLNFVSFTIGNTGMNMMRGNSLSFHAEDLMIQVPECIKEKSRKMYGEVSEHWMGMFTNKKEISHDHVQCGGVEKQGFGWYVSVTPPYEPLEHLYFNALQNTLTLLKSKANTGNADTRQHYKLLIYKIEQALKK
ncbi:zinc-dependent metalloprotease [Sanguibacteroides justesenii]|uniref:Uncharacterized protein n=1 Tax=Sanguibacteroides justesenii TaxID=1547597 RepID=A0A0C3MHL8_9PORP|nr:zinc-dependent metalloprotease [Sanguibacteroides justesenii]KIO46083.1 hypothetical protein BA92_03190 [Sanguibacteroides justesenii]KIO47459.1 hypothetical protein IE90_00385 [Sanguibacteroides justesenii]PXZ42894.1 DUF5117 domain-containing protein [Sanguibacteroides justesenii]